MLAKRTNRTSTNYFVYTADDERYWTYHPGGASSFALRDLDGRVLRVYSSWGGAGTRYTDYVYRGARLLARDTPYARAEAMHLDHLGTPRLYSNSRRDKLGEAHYYPFGEEVTITEQTADRMRFTGHERDTMASAQVGDDLDYLHARFRSPLTGRFLSVDPATPLEMTMLKPQMWNRYAYATGNPLKWADPTGETISLADLTDEQREKLLADLNSFTGNTYGVNDSLELVLLETGAGSSAAATSFFNDLISSSTTYGVVETQGGNQWNAATGNVELNFNSFEGAKYGKVDPRTFNLGSTLTHELYHGATGERDLIDGVFRQTFDWTGPVVDFVNQIRAERSFPQRAAYAAQQTAFGNRQKVLFNHVNPKKPEKIYYVIRQNY